MLDRDEIADANERHWERMVRDGCAFTRPWLDLEPSLVRRFARGELDPPPEPLTNIYPVYILADLQGWDVLLLGAGGGQQSVVFGLLGARVTVVDISEGQLEADREAAAHYDYKVATYQTDMRDLSGLAPTAFDLVYATGLCYVPDVGEVYEQVERILRPGGRLRLDASNPATEFVDMEDWDGVGYRITRPYSERWREWGAGGPIEFRHYLRDVFAELLKRDYTIIYVAEAPHVWLQPPKPSRAAGSTGCGTGPVTQ